MRSILLTLVAAATVAPCALAATSTFTSPIATVHNAKPQEVFVTFANRTSQERDVHVAGVVYSVKSNSTMNVHIAVGSEIRVTSNVNSKIDDVLPQVASLENQATIVLK